MSVDKISVDEMPFALAAHAAIFFQLFFKKTLKFPGDLPLPCSDSRKSALVRCIG
jgi:hypothetical protein